VPGPPARARGCVAARVPAGRVPSGRARRGRVSFVGRTHPTPFGPARAQFRRSPPVLSRA